MPIPASVLERDVLSARLSGYTPRLLDELGAAGEVVWVGRGSLGRDDGRLALYRRDRVELLAHAGGDDAPFGPLHDGIREHRGRGLLTLPAASDDENLNRAIAALPSLVAPNGPYRELRLERVDRGPVGESSLAPALAGIGFRSSYRGCVLRRS